MIAGAISAAISDRLARVVLPWVVLALIATHGAVGWWAWDARGDREAARVAAAQAELRVAHARIIGLTEAQAALSAERAQLQEDLDNAATADPDADRLCLGPDSVFRLGAP